MCFSNKCEYEDYHGECRKGKFPRGWICPPDRMECSLCKRIVDQYGLTDGVCDECLNMEDDE